jgi:hypothetical protein
MLFDAGVEAGWAAADATKRRAEEILNRLSLGMDRDKRPEQWATPQTVALLYSELKELALAVTGRRG